MGRPLRIPLHASGPFDFIRTVFSHGWMALAPNRWDPERRVLERTHRLASGRVVHLEMAAGAEGADGGAGRTAGSRADRSATATTGSPPAVAVTVHAPRGLSAGEREEARRAAARMLRLDEDLSAFHRACAERGGVWAKVAAGGGRLLRSPTVFEDVVKTILTTNVQWGGTKRMARELVDSFGEPYAGDSGRRAFPTAEAIARASPEEFAGRVRLGYRAAYVHALARRVASGEVDLEVLARGELPTPELEKALLEIRGVGPYAAATLLMLLGRYDALPVDTVFRTFVSGKYFGGEPATDAELRAVYEGWGSWKYLAYWCDLLADEEEAEF